MSRLLRSQRPLNAADNYWLLVKEQTDPLKFELRKQRAKTIAIRKSLDEAEELNKIKDDELDKARKERDFLKKQLSEKSEELPKSLESRRGLKRKLMQQQVDIDALQLKLRNTSADLAKREQDVKRMRMQVELKEAICDCSERSESFWKKEFKKADSDSHAMRNLAEELQLKVYDLQMDVGALKTDLAAISAASSTSIDCAICLDKKHELAAGLSALTCGHCFCTPCVQAWWNAHHTRQFGTQCPKCRKISLTPPRKVFIFDN